MTEIILVCNECGKSLEVKKLHLTAPLIFGDKRYKGTMVTQCANPDCKFGVALEF